MLSSLCLGCRCGSHILRVQDLRVRRFAVGGDGDREDGALWRMVTHCDNVDVQSVFAPAPRQAESDKVMYATSPLRRRASQVCRRGRRKVHRRRTLAGGSTFQSPSRGISQESGQPPLFRARNVSFANLKGFTPCNTRLDTRYFLGQCISLPFWLEPGTMIGQRMARGSAHGCRRLGFA